MKKFRIERNMRGTAALRATACAVLALAQPITSQATGIAGTDVVVKYGDLAVGTPQGAMQLLVRIEAAAASVCGPIYPGSISSRWHRDACRDSVVAAAVNKVNRPMLYAAYHNARHLTRRTAGLSATVSAWQLR